MAAQVRFLPAGDRALVVELGDAISPAINLKVRSTVLAIEKSGIPGIVDLVPTYRSVLVCYDPMTISLEDLQRLLSPLQERLQDSVAEDKPRIVQIPTLYGGEVGPDLPFVAEHSGLGPEEVVQIHSGTDYLVYMLGFSPGFPYLGGMSKRIATPRLQTPRVLIPAGSVSIAETQTGIYTLDGPGGWRIIGKTPVNMFDPDREPPALVQPGDYIRFVPITAEEYKDTKNKVDEGTYQLSIVKAS